MTSFAAFPQPSAEPNSSSQRGDLQSPHTAEEVETDGERILQRTLAVKLDFRGEDGDALWKRTGELSWQAARYRNNDIRGRGAKSQSLRVDPSKGIADGNVTKWIRRDEKRELSGAVYSAAEREVT